MGKPRVLCIIGVGHSGSTVLGIALGNHPNLETVGEVYKITRSGWLEDHNRRCACGLPVHECAYWQEVQRIWLAKVAPADVHDYIALQNQFERSRRVWPRLLYAHARQSPRIRRYFEMTAALYEAIRAVSGKAIIVDTSKAPVRGYALLANDLLDARVIHLVRDGRGVVWSGKKPRKKNVEAGIPRDFPPIPTARTSREWVVTNLESGWVTAVAGNRRSLRVLYEHFVEDPGAVLRQLEPLLDEDLSALDAMLAAGEPLQVGHLAGGNQLRMARQVVLRPDSEWRQKLSLRDQQVFWRFAGWLAQRYGYRL